MKSVNSTKKALLASIVSLVLCFSMLLGTTYAWFTDSASTAVNTIQSGNLDMGVYWATPADIVDGDIPEGSWKPMEADKSVFNQDALWEPGYTEVVFFKFVNEGSLAFQYQFNVDILKEVIGKTNDGADIQLSKYIQAYACNCFSWDYTNYLFASNEAATNPVGAPDPFHTTLFDAANGAVATPSGDNPLSLDSWQWLDFEETTYATLVLWMPTTVGNEANHNGTDKPSIDLGINVLATQYTYEKDSFGDQYDKDAEYPEIVNYNQVGTLDELKEAFAEGGNVILTDDIQFEKITSIEPGADVYLNLNGKTITVDENTTSNTLIWVKEGAKLTVDGNGTIDLGSVSTMAIFCPYGELVIENGTFIRDKVTTVTKDTTGLFMGAKITASNVTINGGYFDPGYYDENAANIEDILAGTAVFTETADDIAKRGNSKDANLVRVAVKDNISVILNHSGYGSFKVYGGTFVGANPAWGDEGCMLPTAPNYLRPWSYYQGALLDGQTFNENGIVLPDGYTITKGTTADGIPTYTVEYSK